MAAATSPSLELLYPVHTFSVEEYHRMIETGILDEDDRVELLDGKIIAMSPIGRFHAACVSKLTKFFILRLSDRLTCRQEQPIIIPNISEPEPDFVIVTFREDNYVSGHPSPRDIHLLIEVADKTLDRDRGPKFGIYARAGIAEYWIINLIDRQLEVFTQPETNTGRYAQQQIYAETDTLDHRFTGRLPVTDLLP